MSCAMNGKEKMSLVLHLGSQNCKKIEDYAIRRFIKEAVMADDW